MPHATPTCDLHTHSTASDGTDPPAALAALAAERGLSAIALTDHDTTAGLAACEAACREHGIRFAPGIEISADPGPSDHPRDLDDRSSPTELPRRGTLHILGLFVRHDDPELRAIHDRMREARNERNPAIVDRLNTLGMSIDYDEVEALANEEGTAIIGRPHIAQIMVRRQLVASIGEAFERYLGRGGLAYVRRDRLDPRDAIDAIHHAGGLAILAHPVQLKLEGERLRRFIEYLHGIGLDGIETRHSDHTPERTAQFDHMANELGLLRSGGSDYHGRRKAIELGSQQVPFSVFEALEAAAMKRRGQ